MMPRRAKYALAVIVVLGLFLGLPAGADPQGSAQQQAPPTDGSVAPDYQVDPFWPKRLPNNWILGQVAGVATDQDDDVWIIQRPGSLESYEGGAAADPPVTDCCVPAPPVIEFDPQGNVKQAWGGPGKAYEWPEEEHGIYVDDLGNVWVAGNGDNDHQVLKFSSDGTFLLQIGKSGRTGGSDHRRLLGQPADMFVDTGADEVYIADGYLNHRVVVFDAGSGAYKRHWGAYGDRPTDKDVTAISESEEAIAPPRQFGNPVHCVVMSNDRLVYVCDRSNNRVQVFDRDGTFVREFFIERDTLAIGSTWDVAFSPDGRQSFLYDADGSNQYIWTLLRKNEEIIGRFGRHGRYAGQFHWVHNVAVDSFGTLYTAEVDTGKRVQRFTLEGYTPTGEAAG
jgi:DNA-binding beta-propeller fold protein YncE